LERTWRLFIKPERGRKRTRGSKKDASRQANVIEKELKESLKKSKKNPLFSEKGGGVGGV